MEQVNVQFKKGVLTLCVLVLAKKRDLYGYELVQQISQSFTIAEGTIYPLLRRLTKEGYFTTYLKESNEGPPRKYYQLTDEGHRYLDRLLDEWVSFSTGVNQMIKEGMHDDKE